MDEFGSYVIFYGMKIVQDPHVTRVLMFENYLFGYLSKIRSLTSWNGKPFYFWITLGIRTLLSVFCLQKYGIDTKFINDELYHKGASGGWGPVRDADGFTVMFG